MNFPYTTVSKSENTLQGLVTNEWYTHYRQPEKMGVHSTELGATTQANRFQKWSVPRNEKGTQSEENKTVESRILESCPFNLSSS